MPITLYEATPGALIPSGERTVATYESGLCRVDQVYVCASTSAATHRATLAIGAAMPDGNDDPAIDGLSIFPAPQEIKRQDGFTEFHVSAYGRTTTGIQGVYLEQETISNAYFSFNVWRITGQLATISTQAVSLADLDLDETLYEPFGFIFQNPAMAVLSLTQISQESSGLPSTATYTINGESYTVPFPRLNRRLYQVSYTLDGTTAEGTLQFWIVDPEISIVSSRTFGAFTEIEITTQREGTTPEVV